MSDPVNLRLSLAIKMSAVMLVGYRKAEVVQTHEDGSMNIRIGKRYYAFADQDITIRDNMSAVVMDMEDDFFQFDFFRPGATF